MTEAYCNHLDFCPFTSISYHIIIYYHTLSQISICYPFIDVLYITMYIYIYVCMKYKLYIYIQMHLYIYIYYLLSMSKCLSWRHAWLSDRRARFGSADAHQTRPTGRRSDGLTATLETPWVLAIFGHEVIGKTSEKT